MNPDEVTDFESFLRFVDEMAADRANEVAKERQSPSHPMAAGHNGWENGTIEAFLEAASACAADNAKKDGSNPEPTWKQFAQFLLGGKFYE
jgi:hypothetical protein